MRIIGYKFDENNRMLTSIIKEVSRTKMAGSNEICQDDEYESSNIQW